MHILYKSVSAARNSCIAGILSRAREVGSPLKAAAQAPTKGTPQNPLARLKGGLFLPIIPIKPQFLFKGTVDLWSYINA